MKLTDPWVSRGDVARIHCLQRTQTTRVKTRGKREWLDGGRGGLIIQERKQIKEECTRVNTHFSHMRIYADIIGLYADNIRILLKFPIVFVETLLHTSFFCNAGTVKQQVHIVSRLQYHGTL